MQICRYFMKLFINCLYGVLILSLFSCERSPLETRQSNNKEFSIDFLFDYDGVKVYRFYDGDRYHYFTSKSEIIGTQKKYLGKNYPYYDENVQ